MQTPISTNKAREILCDLLGYPVSLQGVATFFDLIEGTMEKDSQRYWEHKPNFDFLIDCYTGKAPAWVVKPRWYTLAFLLQKNIFTYNADNYKIITVYSWQWNNLP